MPPLPKDPTARRRRNKATTARTLDPRHGRRAPALPDRADRDWHPLTLEWWAAAWRSPMAGAWLDADVARLYMLAAVVDDFWTADSSTGRKEALSEIRLTGALFGLSPIDRRRLQWEILDDDAPAAGPAKPRARKTPAPASKAKAKAPDPRLVLVS